MALAASLRNYCMPHLKTAFLVISQRRGLPRAVFPQTGYLSSTNAQVFNFKGHSRWGGDRDHGRSAFVLASGIGSSCAQIGRGDRALNTWLASENSLRGVGSVGSYSWLCFCALAFQSVARQAVCDVERHVTCQPVVVYRGGVMTYVERQSDCLCRKTSFFFFLPVFLPPHSEHVLRVHSLATFHHWVIAHPPTGVSRLSPK